MFETFEHTADLGLRVRAADRTQLFAEAARALFSVMVANPESIARTVQRTYRIPGQDDEYLLLDWLNELLYTFETERLLLGEFAIAWDQEGLNSTCWGEPFDRTRHELLHEVKAITYHRLLVRQRHDGWLAEWVVDI